VDTKKIVKGSIPLLPTLFFCVVNR
jgi:hypothetical protein